MNSIETNHCAYISVTYDVWLNLQNYEWEWLRIKVSASKIWNVSNCKKCIWLGRR